ncbi:MAG TPA: chemotaxis protein CheW [Gemmataceae bacterium]|nr:chemotaxis protein CheW [Gemmataceae bacterium]
MKPAEERVHGDAVSSTDLADLGAPDFASWAAAQDLQPPDLPDFPVWEPEPPPEEPSTFTWEGAVEEPPVVGALVARVLKAINDGHEDVSAIGEAAREEAAVEAPSAAELPPSHHDAVQAAPSEAGESKDPARAQPAAASEAISSTPMAPPVAAQQNDTSRQDRRDRLRELAARLWTAKPRMDAVGEPHLICALGEEEFALPLGRIQEVQRLPAVTPVPHLPDWLLGVANHRGEVLSVVDLAAFLGLPPAPMPPGRRLVVVQSGRDGLKTGLVVDRVRGLRVLPPKAIEPPALYVAPHVRGVCIQDGASPIVLDLSDLLQSPRMQRPDLDHTGPAAAEETHALAP